MNKEWKEWCRVFLEAAIIVAVLYLFLWPVRINGQSMENALENNDRVTISRLMTMMSRYEYGDLLVFDWAEEGKKMHVIKRVIALEGDTVEIKDGSIFINSKLLNEPYAKGKTYGEISMVVPEEHIFVLGDNREHSSDSRYMGAISEKDLIGKVLFRWYPFNVMGKL